jgi:hypothetical protein
MKPLPRLPRTPSRLSDSLNHQLNLYALAAGAAGVGMLALARSAEAKIVYTPTHHVIGEHSRYGLALNHNYVDFYISNGSLKTTNHSWGQAWLAVRQGTVSGNAVEGTSGQGYGAAALKQGMRVSSQRRFLVDGMMVGACRGICGITSSLTYSTNGPWDNVRNRYLGLKFKIKGKFHYGWARLNVKVYKRLAKISATLTGYAYETIPNKPIIAGKTHGKDVVTLQPASLGALAAGANGLRTWRQK